MGKGTWYELAFHPGGISNALNHSFHVAENVEILVPVVFIQFMSHLTPVKNWPYFNETRLVNSLKFVKNPHKPTKLCLFISRVMRKHVRRGCRGSWRLAKLVIKHILRGYIWAWICRSVYSTCPMINQFINYVKNYILIFCIYLFGTLW